MARVKGSTAIFRGGRFVAGGTVIAVTEEELSGFLDRGFVEVEGEENPAEEVVVEAVESGNETSSALPDSDPLAEIKLNANQEKEPEIIVAPPEEEAPKMGRGRRKNTED